MRKAWREVEENAERGQCRIVILTITHNWTETQTREAFLDSLKSEVLNPLVLLKVRLLEVRHNHS